jgi:hypothetical protein
MMGNGIRSATAAVPHGSAEGAVRETSLPPVCLLITAEGPTALGILSARPGALRQGRPLARGRVRDSGPRVSADPLSAVHLSPDRVPAAPASGPFRTRASDRTRTGLVDPASIPLVASTDLATEGLAADRPGAGTGFEDTAATVGGEVLGPALVGAAAFLGRAFLGRAGAGEAGALAWAGHTGAATGVRAGRMDGIPGGTTLTGTRRGRPTTTTSTQTSGTTILRRTIPMLRMTTIREQVTRSRRAWIRQPYTSMSTLAWATDSASTLVVPRSSFAWAGIFSSAPTFLIPPPKPLPNLSLDGAPLSIACDYWKVLQAAMVPS